MLQDKLVPPEGRQGGADVVTDLLLLSLDFLIQGFDTATGHTSAVDAACMLCAAAALRLDAPGDWSLTV
jgi:hypothetical protein